jgi:hypothetical protein
MIVMVVILTLLILGTLWLDVLIVRRFGYVIFDLESLNDRVLLLEMDNRIKEGDY